MRKAIYTICLGLFILFTGCSKFTDVKPKGMNVLDRVEDLNQVLNYSFTQYAFEFRDPMALVNDMMPDGVNIPDLLSSPTMTLNKAIYTWDESADRALLTIDDRHYEGFYKVINTVANPVLLNVDKAKGDPALAKRYKAEAYVLRAYMHYLVVMMYAKGYNPATAASDPGIPYIEENDQINVPSKKITVQQVYDKILADLQAALDLNSLVTVPINKMRIGVAFAQAAKAQVLMAVRDYDEALKAAKAALAINNYIEDYHDQLNADEFERPEMSSREDIFYASFWELFAQAQTPELAAAYEPGNIFYEIYPRGTNYGQRFYGLPDLQCFASTNICFNNAGPGTVDMYLIKAECLIRDGKIQEGLDVLDTVRKCRVRQDVYQPLTAASISEAMKYVKYMSRVENFFSYKNYANLKRWNTEDAYKEAISKTISFTDPQTQEVKTYSFTLQPDSPLWIFPFPQSATSYNPDLTQNY